jgi:hypothetical protein
MSNIFQENQNIQNGRLICGSSALIVLSLWGALQCFKWQQLQWRATFMHMSYSDYEFSLPAPQFTQRLIQRTEKERRRKEALARRQWFAQRR